MTDAEPLNDPWRKSLDAHLQNVSAAVAAWLKPWTDANEPDELVAAAPRLAAGLLSASVARAIDDIAGWYVAQHNTAIDEHAAQLGLSGRANEWKHGASAPWLSSQLSPQVAHLEVAARELQSVASEFATFASDNSGVFGFAKNALMGYLNPIDGVAALFGKSSMQREAERLQGTLTAAAQALDGAESALLVAADQAVVLQWNTTTVAALNQMAAEVGVSPATAAQLGGGAARSEPTTFLQVALFGLGGFVLLAALHWAVVVLFFRDGLVPVAFGVLLGSFRPVWIYIAGGIWLALCVLAYSSENRASRWVPRGLVLAVSAHFAVQAVSFGARNWFGKEVEFTAAPVPVASADPALVRPDLSGAWQAASGRAFQATSVGKDRFEFREVQGAGVRPVYFVLDRQASEPSRFSVEHYFVPPAPRGLNYAAESEESCKEVISKVDDRLLSAFLNGDQLTVETAKLEVPVDRLRLNGARIIGCRSFDSVRRSKSALTLTRGGTPDR